MQSKAKIEQELKADYITALVYGQEDIAEDQARAATIQQQAEIERQARWENTRVERLQSNLLEEQ